MQKTYSFIQTELLYGVKPVNTFRAFYDNETSMTHPIWVLFLWYNFKSSYLWSHAY